MLSHGLFSLLALSAVTTASPISLVRRSSLFPTPPPACIGKISGSTVVSNTTITDPSIISNVTAGANNTNLTDATSLSNLTSGVNTTTTTTCLIPASQISALMNSTDLSNMTSLFNCTDPTNSTTVSNSTDTTDLSPPSNITDTSDLTPPDDSTDTDTTDDTTDDSTSTDTSTDTSTSTSLPPPADTSTSSPPSDTPPPDDTTSSDSGSSGVSDPTSGQFTADTSDTEGRRRRSLIPKWLPSWLPVSRRSSNHRRIAQADLPAVAQEWQDLCLVSGGDIFTNQPCVTLAGLAGIEALLSTGGICDQQDVADKMIDFAKSAGITNKDALVTAAIAYRQHARNADDMGGGMIPSTPYCTRSPRNPELVGIVNEQLSGVNPGLYGGPNESIVAFGEDGTCPAGLTPDVSTCSCA